MSIKPGWPGRAFEDFTVGDVFPHRLGRTITDVDNIWFTLLTNNPNPIHFDQVYAAQTEFKRLLVDSTFTLALVTGFSVADVSQNAINLGWEKCDCRIRSLPAIPCTPGPKSWKRASHTRVPTMGIVKLRTKGINQDGVVVIEFNRTIMVYKRDHVPMVDIPGMPSSK